MSERIKRFDDIFRFMMIISTIIFSGALSFYRESMPEYIFFLYIFDMVIAIILWSIGHTRENVFIEAFLKLF